MRRRRRTEGELSVARLMNARKKGQDRHLPEDMSDRKYEWGPSLWALRAIPNTLIIWDLQGKK